MIQQYSQEKLNQAVANSTMRQYSLENPFKCLDCFDERSLTEPHQQSRTEPPARYTGAVTGAAIAGLAAIITQYDRGHMIAARIVKNNGGIAGLAAHISTHAQALFSINAHQHSADINEENPYELDYNLSSPIGCKYAAMVGGVTFSASNRDNVKRVNRIVGASGYEAHNLKGMYRAFDAVTNLIGGESTTITRDDLRKLANSTDYEVSVSMVKGEHAPSEAASAVYDFHGYCIAADGLEYVQSIKAPSIILRSAFAGLSLEDKALEQAGIINGSATQSALGVESTKIIPEGMVASEPRSD